MEVQPDERFRESVELQVEGKPQELSPFEKRIPLFGAVAPPQPKAPPPPPVVSDRQKPQFTQVRGQCLIVVQFAPVVCRWSVQCVKRLRS